MAASFPVSLSFSFLLRTGLRTWIGTLRSGIGHTDENFAKSRLRTLARSIILGRADTWQKEKQLGAEERGPRSNSVKDRKKFFALPFLLSNKLKIWSFHVVVVCRDGKEICEKKLIKTKQINAKQICCSVNKAYCFLGTVFQLPSLSHFRKVPNRPL